MAQYYPKSQILPNLYTNGGEFVLSTTFENYKGNYYSTSDGANYTGNNPQEEESILLIPKEKNVSTIQTDADSPSSNLIVSSTLINPNTDIGDNNYKVIEEYMAISPSNLNIPRSLPQPTIPQPTSKDYKNQEFQRYFCKRNDESIFIEINSQTFIDLQSKSPNISYELFTPIQIPWTLTGNSEDQVYEINKKVVLTTERVKNLYGFSLFFQTNYSKYYVGSNTSLKNILTYTNGGEFLLPNRTNYIGYYHQMENGNYMTGKFHGEQNNILLIPLNKNLIKTNPNLNLSQTSTPVLSTPPPISQPSSGGGSLGGGGY